MSARLDALAWPGEKLGEALQALARASGHRGRAVEMPAVQADVLAGGDDGLSAWIEGAARWLGLEAEAVETPYPDTVRMIAGAAPGLLRLPGEGAPAFLALARGGRGWVRVLAPDLRLHRVPAEAVRDRVCATLEAPLVAPLDTLLEDAGVPRRRRARARRAILRERLSPARVSGCWLVRFPPGAGFGAQVREVGLPRRFGTLLAANIAEYGIYLASWWMLGKGALEGRLDEGWLVAWALLLLTLIPFRLLGTWTAGMLAIDAGGLLKRRLLAGSLELNPDEVRSQGAGQLLGRVIESEAVESLALSAGFLGVVAMVELCMAVAVLALGAGGALHVALYLAWVALTVLLAVRYFRRRRRWTEERLRMTHDLVERMVGQRTRLAQEPREEWHEGEDQMVQRYVERSLDMDRAAMLQSALGRGWLIVGLCGLAPAFVAGGESTAALAVSLGGILLASRALVKLGTGLSHLMGAGIAWRQVAPLFHAAARKGTDLAPTFAFARHTAPESAQMVVEAHELTFKYPTRGDAVLRGCSLRVGAGERLLLEGVSGGGKSTLAALLVGMREPQAGLILLGGLDRRTLGADGWRQRVVAAPQFHENHVLTATFAFNLLMGRRWPPLPSDLAQAEAICRELDLGPLLERMPAGLQQMVGETGWQLSHGERSRLYIARALLQGADVVVLDESFGALDPTTLERALRCVLGRARTLLVIAHP